MADLTDIRNKKFCFRNFEEAARFYNSSKNNPHSLVCGMKFEDYLDICDFSGKYNDYYCTTTNTTTTTNTDSHVDSIRLEQIENFQYITGGVGNRVLGRIDYGTDGDILNVYLRDVTENWTRLI
jgi:hypothetical protein